MVLDVFLACVVVFLMVVIWSIKRHREPRLRIASDAPIADLLPSLAGLTHSTLVEGNCVRGTTHGGIVSQDGDLRNAVIRRNVTVGNKYGIGFASPSERSDISITRNTSRRDQMGIAMSGTVAGEIIGNDIDATGAKVHLGGIGVGGGNIGLVVSANTLTGAPGAIILSRTAAGGLFQALGTVLPLVGRGPLRGLGAGGVAPACRSAARARSTG